MNKLPINYQSIIHIINNWNFTYEDSHVKANLEVYVDIEELRALRDEYQAKLNNTTENENMTDEDRTGYIDAVNDLNLAITELESN